MAERIDRIRVQIEGKDYSVVGGTFQAMLAAVKQVTGRRFVGDLKVWQLPGTPDAIKNQLDISGFQLEGGVPIAATPAAASKLALSRPGGNRIKVQVGGHQLAVVGGTFREMLAAVKNLPGRRFDGNSKTWEISGEISAIKQSIETAGFQLEGAEKIASSPAPNLETPVFNTPDISPPPFEAPNFVWDGEVPPYEPPDWWDDEGAPLPLMEPPDWLEDEMASRPPDDSAPPSSGHEPPLFDESPPSFPTPTPSPASPASTVTNKDQIRVRVGGVPFVVTGGNFRVMLTAIKGVPGRRFDGGDKVWEIPAEVTIDGFKQKMAAVGFNVQRG